MRSVDSNELANRALEIANDIKTQFDQEYKDFFRERRRWKSDFDQASKRATTNFNQIENLIADCVSQNDANTQTLKLVIEAQMIS